MNTTSVTNRQKIKMVPRDIENRVKDELKRFDYYLFMAQMFRTPDASN